MRYRALIIILSLLLCAAAGWAKGLVTANSRVKYEPGDQVLFATDLRRCPVGEIPESFEKIDGSVECVRFGDHMWVAPATENDAVLYKRVDLGEGEFSIDFTVLNRGSECDFICSLYLADGDDWHSDTVDRSIKYSMEYCEIYMGGAGQVATLKKCNNKPLHFSIQVRRGQIRLYLDGKRLAALKWPLESGQRISGVSFARQEFGGKPFDMLISDIRIARYSAAEEKPSPEKLGIAVQKTKEGLKLTVPSSVLFDFNKFFLKPRARKALALVADIIRNNPAGKIRVVGYTDSVGKADYNLILSLQRAQSVADFLIYREEISADRFDIQGRGKADPVAENNTETGRAKNRRVEIMLGK